MRILKRQHFGLVIQKEAVRNGRERGIGCDKRCNWLCFVGGKEKRKYLKKSISKLKDSKLILFHFSQTNEFQQGKLYNGIGYCEGA